MGNLQAFRPVLVELLLAQLMHIRASILVIAQGIEVDAEQARTPMLVGFLHLGCVTFAGVRNEVRGKKKVKEEERQARVLWDAGLKGTGP